MRKLHEWNIMPYKERSLSYVFRELHEKCRKANLIKCIEDDAKIMYKSISECKHTKGKNKGKFIIIRGANRKSLIAACIFFACRRKNMTRSPKEIAELFELKYTDMTKGCKNFLKLLKIKQKGMSIGTSQPEDFVLRFCTELKLKKIYADQAIQIAKNIRKLSLASDHTPYSIATGSILLMAEINKLHNITKRKLSQKFEVSEVTITKTYKKIDQYKHILIDDVVTNNMLIEMNEKVKDIVMSDKLKERFKKYNIANEQNLNIKEKDEINIIDLEDSENLEDFEDSEDLDELEDLDDFDDLNYEISEQKIQEMYEDIEKNNEHYNKILNKYTSIGLCVRNN
jgi:transcription initiation factor TFIIIB Brf1 subunit/transcription initiation factor TFIIB